MEAVFWSMNFIPELNLVSCFVLFGVLQAFCLAIIFLLNRERKGSIEFAALMGILVLIELESFLNYSGYIIHWPFLINVSPSLILVLGPLSYLYLKKLRSESINNQNVLIHFIPAIGYFVYSFLFFLQPTSFKINAVLRSFHPEAVLGRILPSFEIDPLNIQGIVVVEGLALHLLCYSMACLINLKWKEVKLKKVREERQWPMFWAIGILLGSVIFLLTGGVVNGVVLYERILPAYFIDIFSMVLVYGTTMFWISRVILTKMPGSKYAKSGLSLEFQQIKLLMLREVMATQKPYKSPDFSLSQLANLSNLSPHQASQVINSGTGMTFNEFVNVYRVEEARSVLMSSANNAVKVEMLAYELGYKSKSAFFTSFRRHTATTPARFRELVQKS